MAASMAANFLLWPASHLGVEAMLKITIKFLRNAAPLAMA
jgi:hypothetical protein